jgi:hypothetical protein
VARANAAGCFGLYAAGDFEITSGAFAAGSSIPQALWYFRGETIAIPLPGRPLAGFSTGVRAYVDVAHWLTARTPGAPLEFPPLVWVAAPDVIRHGHLAAAGDALTVADEMIALRITPQLPLNRSYFDTSSVAFFAQRPVSLRGTLADGVFVARSFWPEDFRFDGLPPPAHPLPAATTPALSVRALTREAPAGGARSPFRASTLWQRDRGGASWSGRPVLAFILSGAQGEDDEAHAGHFAIVTGRINDDGAIGNWLANNFYSLDTESEKGILAAPVPLDNYLGDLNAGQGWYRPSAMLVAVLRDERAAVLVQAALNRVYNQFYRHQLAYYHPSENCASISVDTLRVLGLPVAERGPSNQLLAWIGFPFIAAKERSVTKAKLSFDYLYADQTRLLPAIAFEEIFASLLAVARGETAGDGTLSRLLAQDIDALAFLRMPQFPSSRAFGDAPVISTAEYRARVPKDPAQVQIVPVPERPFPAELRDADLLPRARRPSDWAALVWGTLSVVGIPWLLWRPWRALRGLN